MKADKYLAMTDTFLRQSSKGEIPDKITRDLRFCMDEQEEKLRKNGISMREEYVFDDEAVTAVTSGSCIAGVRSLSTRRSWTARAAGMSP